MKLGAALMGVGLSGMGAMCSPVLPPSEIYRIALSAGFPSDVAIQMTAIALRESSGCPNAYNPGNPPGREDSYGLWQINVKGNPSLPAALGIQKEDLFDPYINGRAAYYLWGGKARNLEIAWYIDRPGYKEDYEQYLPVAYAAAGLQPPIEPVAPPVSAASFTGAGGVLLLSGFITLLILASD